jgi:hypothetical protein
MLRAVVTRAQEVTATTEAAWAVVVLAAETSA